jgi:hypothetical protein
MKDKPPIFNSWKAWYVLVIAFLVLQIILFYLITKNYS